MTLKRTQFPPRTVPLARTTRLARGAPLERRVNLSVVTRDGAPVVRIGQQRGKDTGPSAAVRKLVLARDGYACVCCGRSIEGQRYSLGHRLRASQGGKPVPSNLLTFLGWGGEQCHGRIDSRRDERDEKKGLTVRSWKDPALIPVTLFTGVKVWLADDGRYSYDVPEGAA